MPVSSRACSVFFWSVVAAAIVIVVVGTTLRSLTGAAGRGPDLIVSSVTVANDNSGTYTFVGKIVNQGTNRAVPSMTSLSLDKNGANQWAVKATQQRIGALTPGNSAEAIWSNAGAMNVFSWTATPGEWKAQVCADVDDAETASQVRETNETNNCKTASFTVR